MVETRILGVVYLFVVAAMLSSSLLVTNFGFGFDERIPQVAIAAGLGIFWTGYYAWAIHPKLLTYTGIDED